MSALTKIFVVLLVVLSIIETAGMVVYVNRSDAFVKSNKDLTTKLRAMVARCRGYGVRPAAHLCTVLGSTRMISANCSTVRPACASARLRFSLAI